MYVRARSDNSVGGYPTNTSNAEREYLLSLSLERVDLAYHTY